MKSDALGAVGADVRRLTPRHSRFCLGDSVLVVRNIGPGSIAPVLGPGEVIYRKTGRGCWQNWGHLEKGIDCHTADPSIEYHEVYMKTRCIALCHWLMSASSLIPRVPTRVSYNLASESTHSYASVPCLPTKRL